MVRGTNIKLVPPEGLVGLGLTSRSLDLSILGPVHDLGTLGHFRCLLPLWGLEHQGGGHGAAGAALRIGGVGGDHIAHRGLVVAGRHAGAAADAGQKSLTPFHKTFLLSFRIRSVLPIWERCK